MTPERRERLLTVLHNRQANLTVVLENVEDPHNVSAVLRTCDAVGIQDVYVLTTKAPRVKRWGVKSSSSAAQWLTVHQFTDVKELMTELRKKYDRIFTTHLASGAVSLYDIDFNASVALVFGNEQTGVSEELRLLADGNFIIPMMGIIRSLNISVACAVSIYEAMRQKKNAGHYAEPSLPGAQRAALLMDWGFKEEDL
ncbi:TrmH family RNA methyltransferase [Chitinophaga barathri]|uniref:tRNA (guanosine(18)-2'-O)-methyltransferase n=1 Tax=Chitinophaga barathri TaxID=1647451 RepID=A0A3N4MS43_9BACT|nr:RNA methyltransferase [Chitinophaga barathri]RPD42379.1 RNA methyltransferase [Chitinophaga barathri]